MSLYLTPPLFQHSVNTSPCLWRSLGRALHRLHNCNYCSQGSPSSRNMADRVALRFNLSHHSEGSEGAFRLWEGIHRVDLLFPFPKETTELVAEFAGAPTTNTTPNAIVIRQTCDHIHLPLASFLSTLTGRVPRRYSFGPPRKRAREATVGSSVP